MITQILLLQKCPCCLCLLSSFDVFRISFIWRWCWPSCSFNALQSLSTWSKAQATRKCLVNSGKAPEVLLSHVIFLSPTWNNQNLKPYFPSPHAPFAAPLPSERPPVLQNVKSSESPLVASEATATNACCVSSSISFWASSSLFCLPAARCPF